MGATSRVRAPPRPGHAPGVARRPAPRAPGAPGVTAADPYEDDFAYVRDLGLVARNSPVRPANPLYREVIAPALAAGIARAVVADPRSFVQADGRLDIPRILEEFAAFWREHGDILMNGLPYHEVAPQLALMAFLQPVVNGGGFIDREYGIGRGRIDLLVRWPYAGESARRVWQRAAIQLKVRAEGRTDPITRGLAQLDEYLGRLGEDSGTLVLLDRRSTALPLDERVVFEAAETPSGRQVTVLRA